MNEREFKPGESFKLTAASVEAGRMDDLLEARGLLREVLNELIVDPEQNEESKARGNALMNRIEVFLDRLWNAAPPGTPGVPDESESSAVAAPILQRVKDYLKMVERLGGDTGHVSAEAIADAVSDPLTEGLYRLAKECGWDEFSSRPPELFIRDKFSQIKPCGIACVWHLVRHTSSL